MRLYPMANAHGFWQTLLERRNIFNLAEFMVAKRMTHIVTRLSKHQASDVSEKVNREELPLGIDSLGLAWGILEPDSGVLLARVLFIRGRPCVKNGVIIERHVSIKEQSTRSEAASQRRIRRSEV